MWMYHTEYVLDVVDVCDLKLIEGGIGAGFRILRRTQSLTRSCLYFSIRDGIILTYIHTAIIHTSSIIHTSIHHTDLP